MLTIFKWMKHHSRSCESLLNPCIRSACGLIDWQLHSSCVTSHLSRHTHLRLMTILISVWLHERVGRDLEFPQIWRGDRLLPSPSCACFRLCSPFFHRQVSSRMSIVSPPICYRICLDIFSQAKPDVNWGKTGKRWQIIVFLQILTCWAYLKALQTPWLENRPGIGPI